MPAKSIAKMNCNELQENAKPACYVVKKPRALQWFYKDQLYKESEEERQAGRFELFLDLLCEFSPSYVFLPSLLVRHSPGNPRLTRLRPKRRCHRGQLQR